MRRYAVDLRRIGIRSKRVQPCGQEWDPSWRWRKIGAHDRRTVPFPTGASPSQNLAERAAIRAGGSGCLVIEKYAPGGHGAARAAAKRDMRRRNERKAPICGQAHRSEIVLVIQCLFVIIPARRATIMALN